MKLLLDANLSWRLIEKLKAYFTDCFHVDKIGLSNPAKDGEIWNYALIHQLIIVTNDEDFLNYSQVKGFPPRVVLLRTGNQTNDFILSLLIKYKTEIEALNSSNEIGLLEIF